MTDADEAAASLKDVATTERRTREAVMYTACSSILIMWGVLTACGYVLTYLGLVRGKAVWAGIVLVGIAGTVLIVYARMRARHREQQDWRLIVAMLVLVGFGAECEAVLGPLYGRESAAFWPSLFMFGFVLAGIWLGRFFVVCGVVGILLTVFGYFALGTWFYLWMAAVQGITLILGGWWLRRIGAAA